MSMFPCLNMYLKHSSFSNTLHRQTHNINHTRMSSPPNNMLRQKTHPHLLTKPARNLSRKWLALSSTMPNASTAQCSPDPAHSPPNRQTLPRKPWPKSNNSWTMWQHIRMPSSPIKPATWSSRNIAMPPICLNPMLTVEQADTSSCQMTHLALTIMVRSSPSLKSSRQ